MAEPTSPLMLDASTQARVQAFAAAHQQSPQAILREAVERYLENAEKRERFRQDTLASWAHYQETGLHATGEEVDAWLEKLINGEDAPPPACHT
jgi:predicted transcriptional regulator